MQISITGHHVDVTDALKSYVTEKISRLEKHFDHVTNTHVILSVEKLIQKAEATMHVAGGSEIYADATSEDMYAAIDALESKLDRQIVKHKEKLQQRTRSNGARPSAAEIAG